MDSSWSVEGLEGITTWTIDHNQLLPYHLQLAAKTFPHLTGLSLLSVGEEAYEGLVHFPCLTRLYLSWEVVSAFPLDKLDMPNLKWLHIEIGTVEGLEYADAFMRRYGPNLIGLQVSTSDFLYSNPTLPGGLFALCENLEVLSIPISKLDAAPRPTEPGAIPHAHLRHLMFIFQCPIGGKKVQQHAASFPTEAFPNLKKVTMIGEEPNTHISLGRSLHSLWEVPEPLDKPMLVHEVAVASFPHAFVELVVERD
ncbi:SubName: Full=Uncharacterized protein {ECO:0000313/EMBL:CCA70856.1} [Serendipita indica DSM 11827]|uniref:Uncharacterized protein n=1 Tax=Serendipita indica (strain DSM 11827) TaxID=1109443 RepID=G4THR3_SERID|nr:SubName: Full=Uncharacterized protein {ECO:0000313/EMBL:CCA70856.1} [Serendipita indica DSM 11827]CCA70856.1 hypothetical protein PIIN_04791 [Serendipita indica DSM 11827]